MSSDNGGPGAVLAFVIILIILLAIVFQGAGHIFIPTPLEDNNTPDYVKYYSKQEY